MKRKNARISQVTVHSCTGEHVAAPVIAVICRQSSECVSQRSLGCVKQGEANGLNGERRRGGEMRVETEERCVRWCFRVLKENMCVLLLLQLYCVCRVTVMGSMHRETDKGQVAVLMNQRSREHFHRS